MARLYNLTIERAKRLDILLSHLMSPPLAVVIVLAVWTLAVLYLFWHWYDLLRASKLEATATSQLDLGTMYRDLEVRANNKILLFWMLVRALTY